MVEVVTFGCRLNGAESDLMRAQAEAAGAGDLTIVNTCAVTAEAARQGAQAVRRLARERPGAPLVVTGCAAQIEPERFAAMPGVARVVGNADKLRADLWSGLGRPGPALVSDIQEAQDAVPAATRGQVRSFLAVQNGCDHRCTFCTIPFGRGRSRSVPVAAVIGEVRRRLEDGAREIVLTGVDLTAYGHDLPDAPTLGRLVQAILRGVPDLPRLRLSSIDGAEADPDLLDALATEPRLMPHLHLSLQSGDDLVLKRMRRRHARADAVRFCQRVRDLRPGTVFGADLIAGFPTESEAAFGRSLDLVEACGLTWLHVFPYSARPGTPAARMPQVPREVVLERAGRLRERGAAALGAHLAGEVGRRREVLVETERLGRTPGFAPVRFAAPQRRGVLREAVITAQDGRELQAH